MKVVERREATESLARYTEMAESEPVVVTVEGKPVAALMALENTDLESVSLSTNPAFLRLIERSRARHREEGGVSSEEMRRKLGRPAPGEGA